MKKPRTIKGILLVVAVAFVVASCTNSAAEQSTSTSTPLEQDLRIIFEVFATEKTMDGMVRVRDISGYDSLTAEEVQISRRLAVQESLGSVCLWEDALDGKNLEVLNAAQEIIAVAKISSPGEFAAMSGREDTLACNYYATVTQVPESEFYKVVIAGTDVTTVSRSELDSQDWRIVLQIAS